MPRSSQDTGAFPPFSNKKDNMPTYREPARGQKHEIPTQMGGMDLVMAKEEVPAIAHSDRL